MRYRGLSWSLPADAPEPFSSAPSVCGETASKHSCITLANDGGCPGQGRHVQDYGPSASVKDLARKTPGKRTSTLFKESTLLKEKGVVRTGGLRLC